MNELRIATRGSKLALWQAEHVRAQLLHHAPALRISLVVVKTQGDRILDRPLAEVGGKGLFTKEIEEALLDRRADLAVHSMKDLPSTLPEGLILGAIPRRADPADALVLRGAERPVRRSAAELLRELPSGARIGTSSLRRVCQLRRLRSDLELVALRGNVDTRLDKVACHELDGIVLAAAGLVRLGFADRIAACFTPAEMLPACGQGALGLQCRAEDAALRALLEKLADAEATACALAERAFSLTLGGSCQTPIGAQARLRLDDAGTLVLTGMVGTLDGQQILRDELAGPLSAPAELGMRLGHRLVSLGARPILLSSVERFAQMEGAAP